MTRRSPLLQVAFLAPLLFPLLSSNAQAQNTWAVEDQPFFLPFKADPRAAQINITALAGSSEFPFNQKPGRRRIWDISLGKEIPVFGRFKGVGDPELASGDWWWGLFVPVGFHMVEDFKDASAPIINTDYRFAVSFKYLRGFENRWSVGVKLEPIGHESTHLGDEFTLAASKNDPDFFRINVS